MIRVIYRWQVKPENFNNFEKEWLSTTNRIHAEVKGALGSFMLKSIDNQNEVLTIAKWVSHESWKRFWGNTNPIEMEGMRNLGAFISVEAFEEIKDHTIKQTA